MRSNVNERWVGFGIKPNQTKGKKKLTNCMKQTKTKAIKGTVKKTMTKPRLVTKMRAAIKSLGAQ